MNAKGQGSFKTNADGTVTHRKSVGYKMSGQRKVLTVTAANQAMCIKEMRKKELQWEKQQKKEILDIHNTVLELCERHLKYQVSQDELKPKSVDRRECTIQRHIGDYDLGHMQIQSVQVADIDSHVSRLIKNGTLSASSIEKVLDVLNAAYNWAMMRGELSFNPVAPIKPTLEKRIQKMRQKDANEADVKVLSEEEERRYVSEALTVKPDGTWKYQGGLYGLLLLYTGMRCGEMIALRWGDVDFEQGLLTIEKSSSVVKNRKQEADKKYVRVEGSTKNQKARIITLSKDALNVLRLLWSKADDNSPDAYVTPTKSGKANTATNLEHRIATIFRKIGLEELGGSLHIFRRTFATRMYENGARIKEIAAYIGDLESTTEKYYIAARKKLVTGGKIQQVVQLPTDMRKKEA